MHTSATSTTASVKHTHINPTSLHATCTSLATACRSRSSCPTPSTNGEMSMMGSDPFSCGWDDSSTACGTPNRECQNERLDGKHAEHLITTQPYHFLMTDRRSRCLISQREGYTYEWSLPRSHNQHGSMWFVENQFPSGSSYSTRLRLSNSKHHAEKQEVQYMMYFHI